MAGFCFRLEGNVLQSMCLSMEAGKPGLGESCLLNRLALIKGEARAVSMNENGKDC